MSKYRDSFYNVNPSEISPHEFHNRVNAINNAIEALQQSTLNQVDNIFQQKAYAMQVGDGTIQVVKQQGNAYEQLMAQRADAQVIVTVKQLLASAISDIQSQYNSLLEFVEAALETKVDKTTKINEHTLEADVNLVPLDLGLVEVTDTEINTDLDWEEEGE